jgi:hypothetical protein
LFLNLTPDELNHPLTGVAWAYLRLVFGEPGLAGGWVVLVVMVAAGLGNADFNQNLIDIS